MNEIFECGVRVLLIGAGATVIMDIAGWGLKQIAGVPFPNYGLVGRWIAYMGRGRFRHASIAESLPMRGERVIGWAAHYVIGIVFASALLLMWGMSWTCKPTIGPALIVGLCSVVAPFFVMQPAMGSGIASSRTSNPTAARVRSFTNHILFGVGLYVAGCVAAMMGIC